MTELAAGRGERGPWQQNESRYDYVDDPTVAVGQDGGVFTAWVDQGRKDVFFQRVSPQGAKIGPPVNVSRSPATFSWLPRIALDPLGGRNVFVLWQEIIFSGGSHGGDILFARSQDGGASFGPPLNLSSSVGGDGKGRINKEVWHNGSLDLAVRGDYVYAAWTEYDGPLWFSRSTNSGASFSRTVQLAAISDGDPARAPSLATAPGGTVYLTWTTGENYGADIQLSVSTNLGISFTPPTAVSRTPNYSDAPKVAVDASGTVHVVYAESAGGPFDAQQIHYTSSRDGGRSFAPPREISRPAPSGAEAAGFPALSINDAGRICVSWEVYDRPGRRPRGIGFTLSADEGRSFAKAVLVPGSSDPGGGSNGSHQGLLMKKLHVNGSGDIAIVNSSLRDGASSRVWIMRGKVTR